MQDIISKIDKKQVTQELERRSTLENKYWSDRSSRSTTTTPLAVMCVVIRTVVLCHQLEYLKVVYVCRKVA